MIGVFILGLFVGGTVGAMATALAAAAAGELPERPVYREGFYHGWDDGFAEGVKAADIDNGHEDWWLPTTTEARLKGPR